MERLTTSLWNPEIWLDFIVVIGCAVYWVANSCLLYFYLIGYV